MRPSQSEGASLESRVASLERSSRRWRAIAVMFATVAVVGGMAVASAWSRSQFAPSTGARVANF